MDKDQKIAELKAVLKDAQWLGLTFERGNAYISASYIEKQSELNAKINHLLKETT